MIIIGNEILSPQMISAIQTAIKQAVKGSQGTTPTLQKDLSEVVEESMKPSGPAQKKDFLGHLADGAQFVLKNVAPTVLRNFVPGGGAIASILETITSNDDAWFEKYKIAGATFNEKLDVYVEDACTQIIPFAGVNTVDINLTDEIKDSIFPQILADIREKTNNVLVDDVEKYWQAFKIISNMFAIYYTGKKYIKLAGEVPLNMPQLPDKIAALSPITLNQFMGIIDNLGDYLKSTVGLPCAWTSYLKWRFGTTFLSEHSDRAGIILYDAVLDLDDAAREKTNHGSWWVTKFDAFINKLEDKLVDLRNKLAECGRASADMKIAYKAHMLPYNVENRHYDDKEFNLRCNMTTPNSVNMSKYARLLLSSRLNMNAALQAVTLSTYVDSRVGSSNSPDYDDTEWLSFIKTVPFPIVSQMILMNYTRNIYAGDFDLRNLVGTVDEASEIDTFYKDGGIIYNGTWYGSMAGKYYKGEFSVGQYGDSGLELNYRADQSRYVSAEYYILAAIALQMHYNDICRNYNSAYFNTAPLSYDMALISVSQLEAIQRTALRNLVRADYTRAEDPVPDAKKAVAELVDTATGSATVKVVK